MPYGDGKKKRTKSMISVLTESVYFYLVDVVNFRFSFCLKQLFRVKGIKTTPTSIGVGDWLDWTFFIFFSILFRSSCVIMNWIFQYFHHCGNMYRCAIFAWFFCREFYFVFKKKKQNKEHKTVFLETKRIWLVKRCFKKNWSIEFPPRCHFQADV